MKRLSPFIHTRSLKRFTLAPVDPDQIDIEDIAHALSYICRFNGHVSRFYSVAQHSLMVSDKMPGTVREKLAALLHDAAEAFVCDIPSPFKPVLGANYRLLYDSVQGAIDRKFGVSHNMSIAYYERLHWYDKAACVLEAQAFFELTADELENAGFPVDLIGLWEPWNPNFLLEEGDAGFITVYNDFLDRFHALQDAIKQETSNAPA